MHRSLLLLPLLLLVLAADSALPPGVRDTQNPNDQPPAPAEAVKLFRPTPGFSVSLFAGDPEIAQPIAMDFDDRGRLWVAECFSYPNWTKEKEGSDRITILEDLDGDGRSDRRKVFWNRAPNLTSVLCAGDGVYALCAPNLLFIPDRNHDDVPDGPPVVLLDGWSLQTKHNIVNGLQWGPDGWIYGCHGIIADSLVGKPGTPDDQRVRMNCGIWRYHPQRGTIEALAHGTTNPWGLDFDEHGEAFFTNCVIGHLWHLVPNAHYRRMYGLDFNPFTYELIEATSQHLHWGGGDWTSSRGGKGAHDDAGGGHAHSGTLVYLGDNWPSSYRNRVLMCNIHGNRLNADLLERQGCSYVGKRSPDLFRADNDWFRGVALVCGPDGAVCVSDWCDLGECHDNDGVHRASGRIYRFAHGTPRPPKGLDLAARSSDELAQLQLHPNDWFVRRARRLLQERAQAGQDLGGTHRMLHSLYAQQREAGKRLRALWTLHVSGGTSESFLLTQLRADPDEHICSWALRLLLDLGPPSSQTQESLVALAGKTTSGLVRLHLASALPRLPLPCRWAIALELSQRGEDAGDRVQPLMIWYGIEPAVGADPTRGARLAASCKMPKLRRFIARRIAESIQEDTANLQPLITTLLAMNNPEAQADILMGLRDGVRGRRQLPAPPGWLDASQKFTASSSTAVREHAMYLGLVFGVRGAREGVRALMEDRTQAAAVRAAALRTLVEHRTPGLTSTIQELLGDRDLRSEALRALAAYPDDSTPGLVLSLYASLNETEKQDAIGALSSRPSHALALLDAVAAGRIPRGDLSAFTARQLQDLNDRQVSDRLSKVWGAVRQTPEVKKALLGKYKAQLTNASLAEGDAANGRRVFEKNCMQCHMLHGAGGRIGPDLTGSNRTDLHYVLENIIDPSAYIGRDYQLSNILTRDGRLIAGIVVEETPRALAIQTPTERFVLAKEDVEARKVSPVSMMPEGLIEKLSDAELRDLVVYLRQQGPGR